MFFGWDKVSKRFHLLSTWLTGIGASISAYWILVANAWMQHPVGTTFNPDTVRNEMASVEAFWEVISNPVAISKFFHSVTSGWVTGGVFVVGISCWRECQCNYSTYWNLLNQIVYRYVPAVLHQFVITITIN